MDSIPAAVSGGGVTGLVIVVCWLIYKCCERRSSRCHSGCIDVVVSDGATPNTATAPPAPTPIPTPTQTPTLKPTAAPTEPTPVAI